MTDMGLFHVHRSNQTLKKWVNGNLFNFDKVIRIQRAVVEKPQLVPRIISTIMDGSRKHQRKNP